MGLEDDVDLGPPIGPARVDRISGNQPLRHDPDRRQSGRAGRGGAV